MLTTAQMKAYQLQRKKTDTSKICHAPFSSMNFEQNGQVTACCYNRTDVLGKIQDNSLVEIWESANAQSLRKHMHAPVLGGGCRLCAQLIESGNFSGTKAAYYDEYGRKSWAEKLGFQQEKKPMPQVFEFELSNTCNLACEMCNGYYSSTIRKNIEQLPPLESPYDSRFTNQLDNFLPYLKDAKFLGGEPFLIDIYYDIWEKIASKAPHIKVHITTNGSILNERVKKLLNRMQAGIILSLDSLDEDRYAAIRKGAKLEKVLEHFQWFRKYSKEKNTYLNIAACVMSNNLEDMPALLHFANENECKLHFNTVWHPHRLSPAAMDKTLLTSTVNKLTEIGNPSRNKITDENFIRYKEMLNGLKHFVHQETVENDLDIRIDVKLLRVTAISDIPESKREMVLSLLAPAILLQKTALNELLSALPEKQKSWVTKQSADEFWKSFKDTSSEKFLHSYFEAIVFCAMLISENHDFESHQQKCNKLLEFILQSGEAERVKEDIIIDTEKNSIARAVILTATYSFEALASQIQSSYQIL